MARGNKSIDVSTVPFDQYSRQLIVKNIINAVFRHKNNTASFSILDLGGYKGKTAEFQNTDTVEVLDVFDVQEPGYTKGDATRVNKDNESYDFVCSFDVLEHIPSKKREAFITESARLSKKGIFIAAPMNDKNGRVSYLEEKANEIFNIINKDDHQWLKEHIDYNLPTNQAVESIFKKHDMFYTAIKSNEITKWFSIQSTFFIKSILERDSTYIEGKHLKEFYDFHQQIDRVYNNNYDILEPQDNVTAYRTVYYASHNKKDVEAVEEYVKKQAKNVSDTSREKAEIELYLTLFTSIAHVVNILENEGHNLLVQTKKDNKEIELLRTQLDQQNKALITIQQSHSWTVTKPLRKISEGVRNLKKRRQE